jgi:hypothetical protein
MLRCRRLGTSSLAVRLEVLPVHQLATGRAHRYQSAGLLFLVEARSTDTKGGTGFIDSEKQFLRN